MNMLKSMALIEKYGKCSDCGSEFIGNGQGKLIVEEDSFYRSCKCGWEIKTDEDGKVID